MEIDIECGHKKSQQCHFQLKEINFYICGKCADGLVEQIQGRH